ncbi:hypothetical protein ACOMHN_036266 [Nucella lapillus]
MVYIALMVDGDIKVFTVFLAVMERRGHPAQALIEEARLCTAYLTTLEGSGLLHKDAAAGFSLDRFTKGYALFCFDLTPSLVDGDQFELVKSASMRLELKFAKALPNPVVVLIYGELDGLIEVNKSRQVLTNFTV